MQTSWASKINPVLLSPPNNSLILKQVQLVIGQNAINHRLGQRLQGWNIVRKRAAADIYDTQDANPNPTLTLWLVSDANVVCDIEVF